jgi:hypothetical protein
VTVAEVVSKVEAAGVAFRLDGEKVRVRYPDNERREEFAGQIACFAISAPRWRRT